MEWIRKETIFMRNVSNYWQDIIERHFAEMSPDLLSGLHGYKPHVFTFMLEGIHVHEDGAGSPAPVRGGIVPASLSGTEQITIFSNRLHNGSAGGRRKAG